ncbi:MAG: CoA transferase [Bacteroidota bacterium]
MSKTKTILSLEQALALPYATQRFVQLGWRVIRIESPGDHENSKSGDPNRYIGEDTGFDDLHSYYIPPNIGKEAITLNLKKKEGQDTLKRLIRELDVDVFLCNTLPLRYKQLGIDFESLRKVKPDIIWCGISAMGPDYPDRAGYDPAMQAMLGYMYLTGEPDRDPMLCGLPLIDLKAGDEAFSQVLIAMLEKNETGKRIDISMAQCAASWLITALPQLQFVKNESEIFTRSGNEHRSFIPCNCYPAKDGHVYLAIGNDSQWEKLTKIQGFEHLEKVERITNQGRNNDKGNIYEDIRKGLKNYTTAEFVEVCSKLGLAISPVNSTHDVAKLEFVKQNMLKTKLPSGKQVSLFPAPVNTPFLKEVDFSLTCAPRLGENNETIYVEAGFSSEEIKTLMNNKII